VGIEVDVVAAPTAAVMVGAAVAVSVAAAAWVTRGVAAVIKVTG
jgi:hypothetical protein